MEGLNAGGLDLDMMRRDMNEPEPLTEDEEEVGRVLSERYPDIARMLLQAADITHLSYDQRKNEAFLLSLSDIAATVLVNRMPQDEANEYVRRSVDDLKRELRENAVGPQTGPWSRGEPPRLF